jgi:hypothetical protein
MQNFVTCDLGTWGKRSAKDDQIVALMSQVETLKKGGTPGKGGENKKSSTGGNKKKGPQWKFDRSASSSSELVKNGKTYKWCTGPGHNKTPMWVVHEPGQCSGNKSTKKDNKPNSAGKTVYNRQALTSILKKRGDLTEEEVESKVDAMIAVMNS